MYYVLRVYGCNIRTSVNRERGEATFLGQCPNYFLTQLLRYTTPLDLCVLGGRINLCAAG